MRVESTRATEHWLLATLSSAYDAGCRGRFWRSRDVFVSLFIGGRFCAPRQFRGRLISHAGPSPSSTLTLRLTVFFLSFR